MSNLNRYYQCAVHYVRSRTRLLLACILLLWGQYSYAQTGNIQADLSAIDGLDLSPANIFNYRIDNRSGHMQQVEVSGQLHYRRSQLSFSYKYSITLQPGMNQISRQQVPAPSWTFSEQALRELFFNYNRLPQGTYEYCVNVAVKGSSPEAGTAAEPLACVYQTASDIFLINLVDPEDDAKIYEYNPMLSWVVNYPFAGELTYRLRVAEQKQGQNKQNAITRNNPMYQDNHVMATGTVYPVTARPLVKNQPYVWAVDAYYKGILLGGSEVWRFTIIEDSVYAAAQVQQSYYEFDKHRSDTRLNAAGALKLKYVTELMHDTLSLRLLDEAGNSIALPQQQLALQPGDNRLVLELADKVNLGHLKKYQLQLQTADHKHYTVPFIYINPLYVNPSKQ